MSIPGSLHGIRIVEIGTSVAVPYGCQVLADFGAEVIKVERLNGGDDARTWAPIVDDVSITFLSLNRNKKSVVLNYKDEQGAKLLEELLESADVLVQNLRPGALAKAGFSWERLQEINPNLIYVEMTGYGRTGPRHLQPAYDAMLQAYSGVVAMTGSDDAGPARVPLSMMDMGTGMWLAMGVFDALRRREQEDKGSHIEVSLLQTALGWVNTPLMSVAAGSPVPERLGSGFRGNVPNGAFPASDGHVFLSVGNNESFYRLLTAIEAEYLRDEPGFEDNLIRVQNRNKVNDMLGEATVKFTMDELLERLAAAKVPHSAVNTLDKVLADPQVQAIGQLEEMDHPQMGSFTMVMTGLGLSDERINQLLTTGVIETGAAETTNEGNL